MLNIDIDKKAQKTLSKLLPKHQKQVATRIQELRINPSPHDSEVLKGYMPTLLRNTIGEYRIVYTYDANLLRILIVGKRNDGDIYKQLRRK